MSPAICVALLLAFIAAPLGAQEPVGIFLTWQRDPTTTMTIDWHTSGEEGQPVLHFRVLGAGEWRTRRVNPEPFPAFGRTLHRTELTGLKPASTYEFRFGNNSRHFRFRTMPARADRPIRFATGGDLRHNQAWTEETGRVVARHDPDFVVVGGDLAYADELPTRAERWREWFDAYRNSLITADGRVIPMLVAQGNHETAGGYFYNYPGFAGDDRSRELLSPYFYRLLASPGHPGYGVVDFGEYLSIVLLNTDHTAPVQGEQTRWLERVLAERRNVSHVFPVYHVPAYPSVRRFEGAVSARVRENWVPLFERYGVRAAFENHDHAYKRTHPLRGGQINPDGIVFLGDGAWGVETRPIGREQGGKQPWYLQRGESLRHFILVTLDGGTQHFQAIGQDGKMLDELHVGRN